MFVDSPEVKSFGSQSPHDAGYVPPAVDIALVPLRAFAADIGAWGTQAARPQVADDGAALAAAPDRSDTDRAREVALVVAALNGCVRGRGEVEVELDTQKTLAFGFQIRNAPLPGTEVLDLASFSVSMEGGSTRLTD